MGIQLRGLDCKHCHKTGNFLLDENGSATYCQYCKKDQRQPNNFEMSFKEIRKKFKATDYVGKWLKYFKEKRTCRNYHND